MSAGAILAVVKILLGLANTIVSWAHDNAVGDQAVWANIGKSLAKVNEDLQKVKQVEKTVSDSVASDPNIVRQPDEFTVPTASNTTTTKP